MAVLVRVESRVAGMALAEPGRADDGAGNVAPGWGHVSMVFVHPDRWREGVGTALLRQLHLVGQEQRRWTRTSLWTGQSNIRARRLYASCGYQPTGRVAALPTGEQIVQLQRSSLPEWTPSAERPLRRPPLDLDTVKTLSAVLDR